MGFEDSQKTSNTERPATGNHPEQPNQHPHRPNPESQGVTPGGRAPPNTNAPRSDWPLPSTREHEPWPKSTNPQSHQNDEVANKSQIPSIVTLTGRPSPWPKAPNRVDERCIIYCSQTAARRAQGEPPVCKTWCYRRLFPQDYTSVEERVQSSSVNAESKPRQTVNPSGLSEQPPESFAFDGRYVYFGRSRFRARDRMYGMSDVGLSKDPSLEEMMAAAGVRTKDPLTVDRLRNYYYSAQVHLGPLPSELWSAAKERAEKLVEPIERVISRYVKSFEAGGAQERFAGQIWEKMRNGDTIEIAKKVGIRLWENFWDNGKGPSNSGGGSGVIP